MDKLLNCAYPLILDGLDRPIARIIATVQLCVQWIRLILTVITYFVKSLASGIYRICRVLSLSRSNNVDKERENPVF